VRHILTSNLSDEGQLLKSCINILFSYIYTLKQINFLTEDFKQENNISEGQHNCCPRERKRRKERI
jgi:hypothetical protein